MKKEYILSLAAMVLTVTVSAAEPSPKKYVQRLTPVRSGIRLSEDFTGASADSLIVFVGGEYDGEMMTGGYPYRMQVFEKTPTLTAISDYEMGYYKWEPKTRVEIEQVDEETEVTTHYYNHDSGDLIRFYRETHVEREGFETLETQKFENGEWKTTEYYSMAEEGLMRSEDLYVYTPEGNLTENILLIFDEQGQVMKESFAYFNDAHPEENQLRTLVGSYNEDGTIHTLQDELAKFVTEIDPETGREHLSIYYRFDEADPFVLSDESIDTEERYIERDYADGKLVCETIQGYNFTPADYEGYITYVTETGYNPETSEVTYGRNVVTYHPQFGSYELIEKVENYAWLQEGTDEGKWAWDETTDYKYVDNHLYQVQIHGPIILGNDGSDTIFSYTQYYYDSQNTGISNLRDDEAVAKQRFDLMGRRLADKVNGLYISNGKIVMNRQ